MCWLNLQSQRRNISNKITDARKLGMDFRQILRERQKKPLGETVQFSTLY
jgi:hypothetical protein